ncbi:MAG: hypothetical protein ACD_73C00304G0001, partial [uncultured bacterium]
SGASNAAWDDFVKEGFNALDKEDAQTAVEMLRKAANLGCVSPLVSFKLAIGYESMGAYYSAVQYYELARDQFKKMNASHRYTQGFDNNYARALYSMGQVDKAKAILIKTCNESCDPWALKLLAGQSLAQNDLTKATDYIEKLLNHADSGLSPDDKKELTLNVARIYASNGDNDKAGKYYKQLQELDPANPEPDRFFKKPAKKKSIPHDANWNEYDKIFDMLDNR